jgi:hypothetical protein
MGFKICCSFLAFVACAAAEVPAIQPDWVLVRQPLKWQSPPRKLHSKSKTARAEVIVLNPSGAFAAVYCFLIRQQDGAITISRGDSHSVTAGTWRATGPTVSVKSRLVYADVLPIGKPVPGAESASQFVISLRGGSRTLKRDGAVFKRLAGLRDLEFLAATVACDRTFWDGSKILDGAVSPCRGR